jgi:hypothetical protein
MDSCKANFMDAQLSDMEVAVFDNFRALVLFAERGSVTSNATVPAGCNDQEYQTGLFRNFLQLPEDWPLPVGPAPDAIRCYLLLEMFRTFHKVFRVRLIRASFADADETTKDVGFLVLSIVAFCACCGPVRSRVTEDPKFLLAALASVEIKLEVSLSLSLGFVQRVLMETMAPLKAFPGAVEAFTGCFYVVYHMSDSATTPNAITQEHRNLLDRLSYLLDVPEGVKANPILAEQRPERIWQIRHS